MAAAFRAFFTTRFTVLEARLAAFLTDRAALLATRRADFTALRAVFFAEDCVLRAVDRVFFTAFFVVFRAVDFALRAAGFAFFATFFVAFFTALRALVAVFLTALVAFLAVFLAALVAFLAVFLGALLAFFTAFFAAGLALAGPREAVALERSAGSRVLAAAIAAAADAATGEGGVGAVGGGGSGAEEGIGSIHPEPDQPMSRSRGSDIPIPPWHEGGGTRRRGVGRGGALTWDMLYLAQPCGFCKALRAGSPLPPPRFEVPPACAP